MHFIGHNSIQTRWFITYRFQIRPITWHHYKKNRGDKSHRVIVALMWAQILSGPDNFKRVIKGEV